MATRRCAALCAGGLIAALGLSLTGHGLYLYAKAGLAQWLLDAAWSRAAAGRTPLRPWPWADSRAVARLWLPQQRPLVVLSTAAGSSLAFAPGHLAASAAPGSRGHSVISGHRDTHFRGLQHLERGQRVTLERLDGVRVDYEVVNTELLHVERHRLRHLETDEAWLTLVTCYPFQALRPGGPWRYLVHARAVSGTASAAKK